MEGRGGGYRDGRKSLGVQGGEGKGVGKGEGRENLGGAAPPKYFFLEPRLRATPLFVIEKPEWHGYPTVKEFENMFNFLTNQLVK